MRAPIRVTIVLRLVLGDRTAWILAGVALAAGLLFSLPPPLVALAAGGAFAIQAAPRLARRGWLVRRPVFLAVAAGSREAMWVQRSAEAVQELQRLARSAPDGPVGQRCAEIASAARAAQVDIRRLAGQASAVGLALTRLETGEGASMSDTATAVRGDTAARLARLSRDSQGRLEAAGLTLEGLFARMAEVVALDHAGPFDAAHRLDDLELEMESLRAGLSATAEIMGEVS